LPRKKSRMDKYEQEGVVGEGSYGVVVKCRDRDSGQVVAIKKFLETDEDQTVKKIAMREIRMLKRLRHDNLINLIEVFRRRRKLYLVFEYVDHTVLDELEDSGVRGLKPSVARSHIFQVLRGVEFCHNNQIIHRDVKPENVLVSKFGVVKLCDFGFARLMAAPGEVYTDYVATRWYRAPELLVGDTQYGKEVDVWAVGCLYSEMMSGEPLFPGESDIDQLFQITKLLGPLAPKHRQIVNRNPMFNGLSVPPPPATPSGKSNGGGASTGLESQFCQWSTESLSFLKSCLEMEPEKRPSCSVLLKSVLFTHDNFHITFPPQLQVKLQQEFGGYNTNQCHRKKSNRKHHSINNGNLQTTEETLSHGSKMSNAAATSMRRRLNSDTFDAFFGGGGGVTATGAAESGNFQASGNHRSQLLTGIYSPSKSKAAAGAVADTSETAAVTGKGSSSNHHRIVAPPPTLTSEMGGRTLSSARSELEVNTSGGIKANLKARQLMGFQSPDERNQVQVASPKGLKRYDGFDQGLNNLAAAAALAASTGGGAKGAPYKLSDPGVHQLRNAQKSPPLKKTKRKETYPPVTSLASNPPHHLNPINHVNADPLMTSQINDVINCKLLADRPELEVDIQRFSLLERAFDKHFQIEELVSTPRDRSESSAVVVPPPPTPQQQQPPSSPSARAHPPPPPPAHWSQTAEQQQHLSRRPRGQNSGFSRGGGSSNILSNTSSCVNGGGGQQLLLPSVITAAPSPAAVTAAAAASTAANKQFQNDSKANNNLPTAGSTAAAASAPKASSKSGGSWKLSANQVVHGDRTAAVSSGGSGMLTHHQTTPTTSGSSCAMTAAAAVVASGGSNRHHNIEQQIHHHRKTTDFTETSDFFRPPSHNLPYV